jgi:hypothetical protein
MPTGAGRLEADWKLEENTFADDEIFTESTVNLMVK